MSDVPMADLTPGTRIRYRKWGCEGPVRVTGGLVSVKWDGSFVEDEISEDGPVFPEDVEIVEEVI